MVVGVITGKEQLLMEPGGMPVFYGDRVGQGWREGRGGETGMRSKPPAAARRARQSSQMLLRCLTVCGHQEPAYLCKAVSVQLGHSSHESE